MKQPLANKAPGGKILVIAGAVILIGLGLVLLLTGNPDTSNIRGWVVLICGLLFTIFFAIPYLLRPEIIIWYDEQGLFLYSLLKKEIFVPFAGITAVRIRSFAAKYEIDHSDTLVIVTTEREYPVSDVLDAESVKARILELMNPDGPEIAVPPPSNEKRE